VPLPYWIAQLNKRYTNYLIEPFVRRLPGFVEVHHQGRRTGTPYRTPLYAFVVDEGRLLVTLTYGAAADWVQNVRATGGAIGIDGVTAEITAMEIVGGERARPHLPRVISALSRTPLFDTFALLSVVTSEPGSRAD